LIFHLHFLAQRDGLLRIGHCLMIDLLDHITFTKTGFK